MREWFGPGGGFEIGPTVDKLGGRAFRLAQQRKSSYLRNSNGSQPMGGAKRVRTMPSALRRIEFFFSLSLIAIATVACETKCPSGLEKRDGYCYGIDAGEAGTGETTSSSVGTGGAGGRVETDEGGRGASDSDQNPRAGAGGWEDRVGSGGTGGSSVGTASTSAGTSGSASPTMSGSSGQTGAAGASVSTAPSNAAGATAPGPSCGDSVVTAPMETCDPKSSTPCPTASSCKSNGCMGMTFSGSPDACTAKCETTTITQLVAGDGCCPDGADLSNDSDCEPGCGDGVVTAPETCDPKSATPCPTASSCTSNGCMGKRLTGNTSTCTAKCEAFTITEPVNGDGCCPDGANIGNDKDCEPACGDGVVTAPQETCDPRSATPCPTRATCASSGCMSAEFSGSVEQCTATCERTTITSNVPGDGCCPRGANANDDSDCRAVCGNAAAEPGEECDIGAPKRAGHNLSSATYDEYSCDRTCRRLYIFTPCTVDSGQVNSSECGGNGRCTGEACLTNAGCNSVPENGPLQSTCRFGNGRAGVCYGNACFLTCNSPSECPSGQACRETSIAPEPICS